MRVALANAKGGVAKTTSCIYLAAVLARRGIEVAVYDADPQSSASLWAAAAEQAGDPLPFDVLPANMATLAHLGGDPAAREWSIIDAPPQGPLLDKTLAVADFVIVPTSDSPMDLQQAWDTLDRARHATRAALLPVRVEANTTPGPSPGRVGANRHRALRHLHRQTATNQDLARHKPQATVRIPGPSRRTNAHRQGGTGVKGNYQPLPRPVPFDKVLDQQAEDKQSAGQNNAGEPLVMLSLRLPVRLKNRLKIAAAEHGTPCNRSCATPSNTNSTDSPATTE